MTWAGYFCCHLLSLLVYARFLCSYWYPQETKRGKNDATHFPSPHFTSDNSPGVEEGARFTHSIGLPQNKTSNMQHDLKIKRSRLYKEGNRAVCFKTIHHSDTKQLGWTHKREKGGGMGVRACDRRFCLGKQRFNPFAWESMPRNERTEEGTKSAKTKRKKDWSAWCVHRVRERVSKKMESILLSVRIIPMHFFSNEKNVVWVAKKSSLKMKSLYSHPVPISRSCSQLSQKGKNFLSPSFDRSGVRLMSVDTSPKTPPTQKKKPKKPPLQHNHTRGLMHHVSIHSLCGKTLYASFSLLLLLR